MCMIPPATRFFCIRTVPRFPSPPSASAPGFEIIRFLPMMFLCLFYFSASGTHGLSDIPAHRSRIGFCPLSARRKMPCVTDPSIRLDILQTLHIPGDFASQVSFNLDFFYQTFDDIFFFDGKFFCAFPVTDLRFVQNALRTAPANTVERRERDLKSFVLGNVDTLYSHKIIPGAVYAWGSCK